MKAPLGSRREGFSLIEMITATAVLLVIVLMILQITEGTARSVSLGGKRIDADTEARMLFNRLALDFSKMIKRSDMDYTAFKQPAGALAAPYRTTSDDPIPTSGNPQSGNDRLAFLAETDGYFAGNARPSATERSPIALAAYQVKDSDEAGTPGLFRLALGLGWEPSDSGPWGAVAYLPCMFADQYPNLFADKEKFKSIGDQTFRFEYAYLLKATSGRPARLSLTPWDTDATLDPRHSSVDGFRDVAAIVVTIAVLDRTSREIVSDYQALIDALPDAAEDALGNVQNVAAVWRGVINSPGFAAQTGLPVSAAGGIRIYERYFPVDSKQ